MAGAQPSALPGPSPPPSALRQGRQPRRASRPALQPSYNEKPPEPLPGARCCTDAGLLLAIARFFDLLLHRFGAALDLGLDVVDGILDLALGAVLLAFHALGRALGGELVVADRIADFFLDLADRLLDVALGLVGGGAVRSLMGRFVGPAVHVILVVHRNSPS